MKEARTPSKPPCKGHLPELDAVVWNLGVNVLVPLDGKE